MKPPRVNTFYVRVVKRTADLCVSAFALLVLSPLMVGVSMVLYFANGGQVFFVQKRVGKNEREFFAYKFKTMNDRRDPQGQLLPDAERLTPVGKWVRKTSLDELPQLLNVLKGEMSFVGPRPLLPEYLPYYNETQKWRHLVPPGITGLAQVNGRNLTTWDRRFELDVEYVQAINLWLDLSILVKTIWKVIRSEGISAEGHATMPKFSDYVEKQRRDASL